MSPQTGTDVPITRQESRKASGRLPWGPLLALALVGFVCIVAETMPAGLLPEIATDLGVSEAAVGQWVSIFAAASVLAALPAMALTRGVRRKPLLMIAVAGILVSTVATAIAPTYEVAMAARAVAGVFSGLLWAMLAGYARRLAPPRLSGRAIAVAMAGIPIALSLGTPLGTLVGGLVGWRWAFAGIAALTAALLVWIALGVGDRPGQAAAGRTPIGKVILLPGVGAVLGTTLAWMLAHNILYTYIAPLIAWTGSGVRVDVVLLVFGIASIAGNWVAGLIIDRALRILVLCSLAVFALASAGLALAGQTEVIVWGCVIAWGLSFGGAAALLLTALADASGHDSDFAQAMMTTTWNLAIFGGAAVGGILLEIFGPGCFPYAVGALAVLALVVAAIARRNGFRAGHRHGERTLAIHG